MLLYPLFTRKRENMTDFIPLLQTEKTCFYGVNRENETNCCKSDNGTKLFGFVLSVCSRMFIGGENCSLPRQIVRDVAENFSAEVPKHVDYRYRRFIEASS
jgi:hypothetical protein